MKAIYEQGIATRNATFETTAPRWEEWDSSHFRGQRLVAEVDGEVVGWAALAPVSARPCYAGVAEASLYVAEGFRRRGIGRALLEALLARSERDRVWTVETGVFPENEASLALLRACGFRVVGLRERIGRLDSHWRDVVLVERRSEVVQ